MFFGLSLEKEEKGEGEKRKEREEREKWRVFGRKQIGLSRLNPKKVGGEG